MEDLALGVFTMGTFPRKTEIMVTSVICLLSYLSCLQEEGK